MGRAWKLTGSAFVLFASAVVAETTPPQLVNMSVSPLSFDASSGPVVLTVSMAAHDAGGFNSVSSGSEILFVHESGSAIFGRQNLAVTDGSLTNPIFQFTVTIPQFSPPGPYRISVTLADSSHNSATFSSSDLQARGFPSFVTIAQSGAGSISLSPATASAPAGGRSGSLQVTASSPGVSWSAASNASWLTITSGAAGAGNGTISYLVAQNNVAAARTAIITVNGQTFTVTQAASAASVNVTPSSLAFTFQPGGAAPGSQTLTIYSSGATLNFTAAASSVGNWLFVTPTGGATSTVATVWVDPAGLAAGTYTGFVTVSASGSANGSLSASVTLTVSSPSNFSVTPTTLSFSSPHGGNPTPRTVSITGGAGGFTASAGSSGWLVVNPGNATSPSTLTVSVFSFPLAPGNYSGSITITGTASGTVQTIPVSLAVTAAQSITASPASLTFTHVIGAGAPAPQSLTVFGTASGVSYTTTQGSWLTLGASASPVPGGVAVFANPQGLAAGVYISSVVVTADGGASQTIPVSLVVSSNESATVFPASLSFVVRDGIVASGSQTISVTGLGTPAPPITVSNTGAWLHVSASAGTTGTTLTVSVIATGLAIGTYNGSVNITVGGSPPTHRTVPVSLTVEGLASGPLLVSPASVEINYQAGDPAPITSILSVSNSGQGLSFTATASSTGNWLSVSPPNGSSPASLALRINPVGLAGGLHTGTIQIASLGQAARVIAISLNIRAPQDLTVSSSSLSFTHQSGSLAPASETLTIGCSGSALSFRATATSTGNWLTTAVPNSVSNQLIVSVNPSGLSIGSHAGTITLFGAGACNRSQIIPVTLTVSGAPPAPSVPESLSFHYQAGGTAPASQSIAIACGAIATPFSAGAASSGGWLRVSPFAGNTPASVAVSVQTAGLTPGSHTGHVTIVTSPSCAASRTVAVTVEVSAAAPPVQPPITSALSFSAASLNFTVPAGGSAPPTQAVSLGCGGAVASFTSTAVANGGWLLVSPASGNTPAALTASVNASGLAPGSYSGSIVATSPACGSGAPLPVTLTVTESSPAVLSVTPASLTFNHLLGGPAPTPQSLAISSAIGQPFTLTASSGAGWLSVNPLGATAPATVSVSVSPAGLAPGTYSGIVLISTNNGSSGSTQNVGVTLNVSGSPPPLSNPATKPYISSLVNAASLLASPLAPGQIISIFGRELGPAAEETLRLSPANLVESSLAGTRVLINGRAAPILFAQAGQINTIVPYSAAGRSTLELQVEHQGVLSLPARFSVAEAAPAIFTLDGSGRGPAALLNQDTSVNLELNPADRGSIAVLYASGAGVMAPVSQDGAITGTTLARPVLPVSVLIDGQDAPILYAGAAPGLVAGVLQVNFRVPPQVRAGAAVGVLLKVGRLTSQAGVTMAIR